MELIPKHDPHLDQPQITGGKKVGLFVAEVAAASEASVAAPERYSYIAPFEGFPNVLQLFHQ